MERLARAYNERLRGAKNPEFTEARTIAEEQLAILDKMAASGRNTIVYLKSLKSVSLSELRTMEGFKTVPTNKTFSGAGGFNRLTELEIELFIAADTLTDNGADLTELIRRETRFTAFLALLPFQNR